MIVVDSNVPMHLVGAPHPHKTDAQHLLERAKQELDGLTGASARDALHVAVMRRYDVTHVLSFDTAFDGGPGIARNG